MLISQVFATCFERFKICSVVDHMRSHDYLNDLITLKSTNKELENSKFYYYDSGAYISIVISLKVKSLPDHINSLIM